MTSKSYVINDIIGVADGSRAKPVRHVEWSSSGNNTPGFLRKQGILSENPYTVTTKSWTYSQSRGKPVIGSVEFNCNSNYFASKPTFGDMADPTFGELVPKLLENWRKSSFDLGIFIGEGRESARMIYDRLTGIANAAVALKNRNLGGAIRALAFSGGGTTAGTQAVSKRRKRKQNRKAQLWLASGNLSNAWLELQYGWLPLINDIYDASDFIKLVAKQGRVHTAKYNKSTECAALCAGIPPGNVRLHRNERRLHLTVIVDHAPSFRERLGLTNPAYIAWNLVPFSFMVDWFLPIGDYLQSLHAITQMHVSRAITTRVVKRAADVRVDAGGSYCGYKCLQTAVTKYSEMTLTRTVSATLPLAWLADAQVPRNVVPSWDWNVKRVANAAALAHQSLLRLH